MMILLRLAASGVNAARDFESTPFTAPIATAGLAVPLAQAFPFLPVREDRLSFVDGALHGGSNVTMDNWNDFCRAAFRAMWNASPLAL